MSLLTLGDKGCSSLRKLYTLAATHREEGTRTRLSHPAIHACSSLRCVLGALSLARLVVTSINGLSKVPTVI